MQETENQSPSASARVRLLGAGVVLLAVFGWFFYQVLDAGTGVMQYYHTLTEFQTARNSNDVKVDVSNLRLNGFVKDGTIDIDTDALTIDFVMTDGYVEQDVHMGRIDVSDLFKDGANVVVEGKLADNNIFYADTLLAKCPTKYESAEDGQQASRELGDSPSM